MDAISSIKVMTTNKGKEVAKDIGFAALHYALWYTKQAFLTKFGREYSITDSNSNDGRQLNQNQVHRSVMMKFLEKYDKNFDKHFKDQSVKGKIVVIPVVSKHTGRTDTFIYVASGEKLYMNSEEAYHYGIRVNASDLYVYIFGKSSEILSREIERMEEDLAKTNTDSAIFDVTAKSGDDVKDNLNIVYYPINTRPLDTLYFSHGEMERVLKHLEDFDVNKEFYEQRHLLYKTGILLYGEPGTGKSSMVNAIAGVTKRNIISIHVDQFANMDIATITDSINMDSDMEYIVLLEDIDTLFLNRNSKNVDKEEGKVINKMLQFLDSNSSPKNVIFMATTNHLDRLDAALTRDGRFDLIVEVMPLDKPTVKKFCNSFKLDDDAAEDVINEYYERKGKTDLFNQSVLQNIILKHVGKNVIIETAEADKPENK